MTETSNLKNDKRKTEPQVQAGGDGARHGGRGTRNWAGEQNPGGEAGGDTPEQLDRSKIVYLALELVQGKPMNIWQMHSAVFLLQQRIMIEKPYAIEVHRLGPYSDELQKDLNNLVKQSKLKSLPAQHYSLADDPETI